MWREIHNKRVRNHAQDVSPTMSEPALTPMNDSNPKLKNTNTNNF